MSADFRIARATDIGALVAIEAERFDADRISARAFRHLVQSHAASVIVVSRASAILGYCVVLFRSTSPRARLYSIAIRPDAGRAGLGRRLLDAAEEEAIRRGRTAMTLEVRRDNAGAIALYDSHLYRQTGIVPDYYADGAAALRYEKWLEPEAVEAAAARGTSSL